MSGFEVGSISAVLFLAVVLAAFWRQILTLVTAVGAAVAASVGVVYALFQVAALLRR